jgi:hypothetical protein
MNTPTITEARPILEASADFILGEKTLTDDQVKRAIQMAAEDSAAWMEEAKANNLPDPDTMHLDWFLDDLEDSGITWANMQRLSFKIAQLNA